MLTLELVGKYNEKECWFSFCWYFIEKVIIAKSLDSTILHWWKERGFNMEKYITKASRKLDNFNPAKVNVIDPTKNSFTLPLSVKEILGRLEISKDYYRLLQLCGYQKIKICSCIWKDNLIPTL